MAQTYSFHSDVSGRIDKSAEEFMTLRGIFLPEVVFMKDAIRLVADLMCIAARTAPKAAGNDLSLRLWLMGYSS